MFYALLTILGCLSYYGMIKTLDFSEAGDLLLIANLLTSVFGLIGLVGCAIDTMGAAGLIFPMAVALLSSIELSNKQEC